MTSKIQHISDEELNKIIPCLINFEQSLAKLIAAGVYREEYLAINRWNDRIRMPDRFLILMRIKFTNMWNQGLRPDKDLQTRLENIRKEKDKNGLE